MTYLITAKEVQSVLTYPLSLKTVEAAFKAYGQGKACLPPKSYLIFKDGDLRSMPAYINTPGMNITNMRTGAAGGVATKYLSRSNSKVMALVGAGAQACTQLHHIMLTRNL